MPEAQTENASRIGATRREKSCVPTWRGPADAVADLQRWADDVGAGVFRDREEPTRPGRSRRVESGPTRRRPSSMPAADVTTRSHAATSEKPTGSDGGPAPFRTRRPAQDRDASPIGRRDRKSPVRAMPQTAPTMSAAVRTKCPAALFGKGLRSYGGNKPRLLSGEGSPGRHCHGDGTCWPYQHLNAGSEQSRPAPPSLTCPTVPTAEETCVRLPPRRRSPAAESRAGAPGMALSR